MKLPATPIVLGPSRKPSNPNDPTRQDLCPARCNAAGWPRNEPAHSAFDPVKANPNSNEPGLSPVLRQLSPLDYELMAVMGAPGSLPHAPSSPKSTARARGSRSC